MQIPMYLVPKSESFGYRLTEEIYRCALCVRQFRSYLGLRKHEYMSEMHLLNLKNTSPVSQGRSRLADVLRSTANGLVNKSIDNHSKSIAEYIRHVQCIEAAEAN